MKYVKFSVTIALLAVLGVLLYYYMTNKDRKEEKSREVENREQISSIINKNFEKDYPISPREVINLYIKIQECYYNIDCGEDEINALADWELNLMDEELLAKNPRDEFMEALKSEIKEYKREGKHITGTILDKSTDVQYYSYADRKNATLNCTYFLNDKKGTTKVVETFVLRKDSMDRWKIFGYKIYEPEK